jgi:hypothetical protein
VRLYEQTLPDGGRRIIIHLDERKRIKRRDPRLDEEGFPFAAGDPDPEWCSVHEFGPYDEANPPLTGAHETDVDGEEAPMRAMSREEVEAQQDDEAVAVAREELAARRAREDQEKAAAASPFAGGGRHVRPARRR